MSPITHVYVTYIAASPERIWHSLTDGDTARRYWNGSIVSDWKPGSEWHLERNGSAGPPRIGGSIREYVPPRRLAMSWKLLAEGDGDAESEVLFEIETMHAAVRLTVTHSELDPIMAGQINGGWPRVLASLKSLLETGRELDVWGDSGCGSTPAPAVVSNARV